MNIKVSKEEAWKPIEGETKIKIKADYPYKFTKKWRWFKYRNQITYSTFLPDRFAGKPINMIQIGVFEGMDLVWSFQHLLTHPDSRCLAIDPWMATNKIDCKTMQGVYETAQHNLRPFRKRLELVQDFSQVYLAKLLDNGSIEIGDKPIKTGEWDLIIIDGDHNADAVYDDAVWSYQLARIGGWLLFDDVRNNHFKKNHVYDGLERFNESHGDRLRWVWYHRHMDCYEKLR